MSSAKRQPNKYFDVVTYTGNGSTQDVRGLDFQPDLVWLKSRSRIGDQGLFDAVRGAGYRIYANDTSQQDPLLTNALTSFNSDGFSLGDLADVNQSTHDFVAWCWKAGDTTETIAVGSKNGELYNTSQVWSSGTESANWSPGVDQLFNGNPNNGPSTPASNTATYTFPSPITANTSIEVYAGNGSGTGTIQTSTSIELIVDGQTEVVNGAPGLINTGLTGRLSGFNLVVGSGSGSADLRYIVIDGKILVDSNATPQAIPSVPTTVNVNRETGFSISTYTGNGASANIYHGLGTTPDWIVVKNLSASGSWIVWHSSFGTASNTDYLYLNDTINAGGQGPNPFWNETAPTSASFSVGGAGSVNSLGSEYVAYCWAAVPGFLSTGTFRGNASASNGKYIDCGFKPRFVLIKSTTLGSNWVLHDTERDAINPNDKNLQPNRSDAEASGDAYKIDIVSSGFKLKNTNSDYNGDQDYIYLAFADESGLAEATQVLDFSDTTNLESISEGAEITTPSGAESKVISNDGTNIEVLYNASGPFAVGEVVSIQGQGSGTITNINKVNNTITLSDVSEFYSVGQSAVGSVSRHGAMAVSDTATSVLEAPVGYTVPGSVTFNKAVDTELNRTPAIQGDRTTWTWSAWVKRANIGGVGVGIGGGSSLFSTFLDSGDDKYIDIHFNTDNQLKFGGWETTWRTTAATFTDTSGWHHFVFVLDTSNTEASERIRLYADGVQITDFATSTDPALDEDLPINQLGKHKIGANGYFNDNSSDFDGSITEVHFVDGKALDPSDFAYELAGWWLPRAYNGDHGTNGFYLPIDPYAASVNYSSYGVAVPLLGTVDGLFNGDNSSNSKPTYSWNNESGGSNYLTIVDAVSIPASTFQFTMDIGSYSWEVRINDTDVLNLGNSSNIGGSGTLTAPVTVTSGTINKIEIMYSGNSSALWAFYADGKMLVNQSSIGLDASGNGNDWTAVNMEASVLGAASSPAISAVGQTATFQNNTDLDKFNPGDALQGGATVVQVNADSRQMTTSGAGWRVNLADSSQVWSDSVVGPTLGLYPVIQGFDGNEDTYTYSSNAILGDSITATFDITGTTFRIKAWAGSGYSLLVNGTDIGAANREWVDVSSIVNGRLTSVQAQSIQSGASAGWSMIEVDGKVLLDPSLDDYVWSAGQTGWPVAAGFEIFGPEKAFDGNTQETNAQSPSPVFFSFSGLGTGTVGIVCNSLNNGQRYAINGTPLTASNTTETPLGNRKLFTYNTPVELSTINQLGTAGSLYGVYVDGKLLIDAGIRGYGISRAIRAAVDGDTTVNSPSSAGTDTRLGGEVIGNYATLDPISVYNKGTNFTGTFSEGNLTVDVTATGGLIDSTFTMYSGKFYVEASFERTGGNGFIGVSSSDRRDYIGTVIYLGSGGSIIKDGGGGIGSGESWDEADVVGCAYDADNALASFYKNGVLQDTVSVPKNQRFYFGSYAASPKYTVNFGAKPFKFPAPAGYLCLCDTNM